MEAEKIHKEILAFIGDYLIENHKTPSYRTIQKNFNLFSKETARRHVNELVKMGKLEHKTDKYNNRLIKIVDFDFKHSSEALTEDEIKLGDTVTTSEFYEKYKQTVLSKKKTSYSIFS